MILVTILTQNFVSLQTTQYYTVTSKSSADTTKLQQDFEKLQSWEECWQMKFNVTKCHNLQVTNKKKPKPPVYHLHGHQLEEVESAKYLDQETQLGEAC